MSIKETAYWILTFLACAGMILGSIVGILLLLSVKIPEGDWPRQRKILSALNGATWVADGVAIAIDDLGPPDRGPEGELWTRGLCETLKSGSETYQVLSQQHQPNHEGYYVAVLQPALEVNDGTGGTRRVPLWFTYTLVVSPRERGSFTIAVLRLPGLGSREDDPRVMVRVRSHSAGRDAEEFVATPEFWKQAEPDLLGAFPGRSIKEDPLPRFFEAFVRYSR